MAKYPGSKTSRVAAVAALLLVCLQCNLAAASTTSVSPVQIFLSTETRSALLTVSNEGSEAVRFQINVYGWTQSERGQMQLAPTSDIIFFPLLVSVPAGESRKIRVGTTLPSSERERTYRLFLEELPGAQTSQPPKHPLQIRVLSKIGVPLFLRPVVTRTRIEISDLRYGLKSGTFSIKNEGTVFAQPGLLSLTAADDSAKPVYEHHWQPWYLLAGSSLMFDFPVPAQACARVRSTIISMKLNDSIVSRKISTPSGVCST